MSKELATVNPSLPAIFQQQAESYNEFSEGVTSGFPVISYRGKVWRVKHKTEEEVYLDDEGEAVQSVQVVLIKSNPRLAKIFYKGQYSEGDTSPPDCWSADGIRPDAGVEKPVSKTCEICPNNVWGSKITPGGAKTRACADVRRMAVAMRDQIEAAALDPKQEVEPLLLRVPPASLNPLKDYIEKMLKPKGVPPYALITRVGFDTSVAYPKLSFKGIQFLNDDQAAVVVALRDSEEVKRILAEATEYSAVGTTGDSEVEVDGAPTTTEAGPTPAVSTMQPAQEEELNAGEDTIAPAAAATEPDEIAPPATTKKPAAKKKKKTKAKAKPAEEPVPAQGTIEPEEGVATDGGEEESFDKMLAGLLDG